MFDMKTLEVKKKVKAGKDGLDGIMYDDATDKILTINHSKPTGTAVVIDVKTGEAVATIPLSGNAPEGGVSDGKGRIFINIEDKNAIDVIDTKTWKVVATWSIAPCDGPTGIAMDRATNRIFSGCSKKSVVVDAATGKVVAEIANGDGVDALGWDQAQKLIYIPAGAQRQRDRGARGFARQVHGRRDRSDDARRENRRRGRDEARCLRLRSRSTARARRQRRPAAARPVDRSRRPGSSPSSTKR